MAMDWQKLGFEDEFYKWAFFPNTDENWTIEDFKNQRIMDSFDIWNECHGHLLKLDQEENPIISLLEIHKIWEKNKEKK